MKILTTLGMLLSMSALFAGNGDKTVNPPCNCGNDQVNIYAAGVASLEGGNAVKCTGDAGTCWEVVFKPGGGWILTIYLEDPISFSGGMHQDNPPAFPTVTVSKDNYNIYEWDTNVWK